MARRRVNSGQTQTLIKPPALRPGDRVGVVAPASYFKRELFERGVAALRRMERLVLRHEEEIAGALTPAERRTLMRLLARLYQG